LNGPGVLFFKGFSETKFLGRVLRDDLGGGKEGSEKEIGQ